jgi:hypothetical protein
MQALSPSLDSRGRSPAACGPTRTVDASDPNGRGTGEACDGYDRSQVTGEHPRGSLRTRRGVAPSYPVSGGRVGFVIRSVHAARSIHRQGGSGEDDDRSRNCDPRRQSG